MFEPTLAAQDASFFAWQAAHPDPDLRPIPTTDAHCPACGSRLAWDGYDGTKDLFACAAYCGGV